MLIIGSQAMRHHGLMVDRLSRDIDFVCTQQEYDQQMLDLPSSYELIEDDPDHKVFSTEGFMVEFTIAREGDTNWDLLNKLDPGSGVVHAPPHVLLLLKESHKYKKDSPHFYKTMEDIKVLRDHFGPEHSADNIIDEYGVYWNEWFCKREAETYTNNAPKLNQGKKDFFSGDGVEYIHDHDSTHEAVAIFDRPAYKEYLVGEVQCSRELFEGCSYATRLAGVVEECYVLALERSLVPYNFSHNPYDVFKYALQKVCTSITSGYFRAFAWENHAEALERYDSNFVDKFKRGLEEGVVKPFAGASY